MSQWQLTSGLDDGLYLAISPPISDLDPGSAETGESLYPWGAPPSILLLSIQPLT